MIPAHLRIVFVAVIAFASAALPAHAATRTWICNWLNNNWATATNWAPAGVPQNGDSLVFPSGVRSDSVNNIASLRVDSVTVTGSTDISGNGITVSNGIVWSGAGLTFLNIDVTLGGSQTFEGTGSSLHFGGDINLNGFNLAIDFASNIDMNGGITGTGNVTKSGAGRLLLGGGVANTFNGSFTHFDGELWAVKKPCFPGNFTSYDHTIIYNSGVFSSNHTISLHLNALLEANNDYTNTTANLIIAGARIEASQMILAIRSNLTSTASSTVSEIITKLDLGNTGHTFLINNGAAEPDLRLGYTTILGGANGGFTKTGNGTLQLADMAGTYGGVTTISNGIVEMVGLTTWLGNSSGKTVVHSNTMLRINSAGGGLGEPLELHGAGINGANAALHVVSGNSSHQGSITVPVAATIRCDGVFHASSVLAGAGDFRFSGNGEFWTQGNSPNTVTGDIIVESGTFMLNKPNNVSASAGTIIVGTNGFFGPMALLKNFHSNQVTGPVIINPGARWEIPSETFEGAPDLTLIGDAEILANGGTFQLDGTMLVKPTLYGSTALIYGGNVSFGSGATRTIDIWDITPGNTDFIELIISPSVLSGSAPVLKTGAGDLRLSGMFSFSSVVTVDQGDLHADGITPLGGNGSTTVASAGRLILEGGLFDTEPLVINGGGSVETGNVFIDDSSGWRAPVTLNAPLRAYAVAGETWTVNSPISGIGAFLVTGPGTVLFAWDRTNTYTGGTWVKDGELRLDRDVANVAVPGSLTIGDGVGAAGSARVVTYAPNSQIADTSEVYLFSDGRLIHTNTPAVEIIRTLSGFGEVIVSNATLRLNDSGNDSTYSGASRSWRAIAARTVHFLRRPTRASSILRISVRIISPTRETAIRYP